MASQSFWQGVWTQYRRSTTGMIALWVVLVFSIIGLYAPFFASSKPLFVNYNGSWYFPLFRYLFYPGFFSKALDVFYNLLMFVAPLTLAVAWLVPVGRKRIVTTGIVAQGVIFFFLVLWPPQSPASDPFLNEKKQQALQKNPALGNSWDFHLAHQTDQAKLDLVLRHHLRKEQDVRLQKYAGPYSEKKENEWVSREASKRRLAMQREGLSNEKLPPKEVTKAQIRSEQLDLHFPIPTLWQLEQQNLEKQKARYLERGNEALVTYLEEREAWLDQEEAKLSYLVMPLMRSFHWEDDAGGEQSINRFLDWWELSRVNRKDLVAGLLFGVRISLVVGLTAIGLAILIGVPIGALAGYYGGRWDMVVMRLIEIWESMPSFFMLLMVVAVTQSKSIFLVIAVIGIFGWTGFARYIRGEFLKQRNLPYVEACQAMGFRDARIVFSHILPNAIPPLLTLLPFSVMGAITAEAGLSFLGLGEEGSCSWGVLMDEGRAAFPGESYLLWPPAILLTLLLVAIALVGDSLRDALDPKLHRS